VDCLAKANVDAGLVKLDAPKSFQALEHACQSSFTLSLEQSSMYPWIWKRSRQPLSARQTSMMANTIFARNLEALDKVQRDCPECALRVIATL
jgi:hypothetical protein